MANTADKTIITAAFLRHTAVLQDTAALTDVVFKSADMIASAAAAGHTLFSCGNGGSASDAQHLAAEFTCRYKNDRKPLAAVLLGSNFSHTTAVGNDYAFEDIFSREIEALGRKDDILVAFTTSGGSKNVLKAIDVAREKGMKVIVLTGEKGKHLEAKADVLLAVPSGETARIQEMHELIYHAWCEYCDAKLFSL